MSKKTPHLVVIFSIFASCFLFASSSTAQTDSNTAASASAAAAAAYVVRPGHLGRTIGDIERMIHFYHDLLGLKLNGDRDQELPFWSSQPLIDFVSSPRHAEFRAVHMPIPGTSYGSGSGVEMTVEVIEFRNIDRRQLIPRLQDTGVSNLKLILRDLDDTLARLKEAGVPIVSSGGEPVAIEPTPGLGGTARAIIVRDPDGYPVELIEITPTPQTNAPTESNVIGAHISLVVSDTEQTLEFYRNLIGADLQTWSEGKFHKDKTSNQLRNTTGAERRLATMVIPGSSTIMEFIQYRGIDSKAYKPVIQDIGVAHIALMVNDMETIMQRLTAMGVTTLGRNGGWYWLNDNVRALYARDPDGFFVEVMERK